METQTTKNKLEKNMTILAITPEIMKEKDDGSSSTNRVDDEPNDNMKVNTPSTSETLVASADNSEKNGMLSPTIDNVKDKTSVEVSSESTGRAGVVQEAFASPKPCSPLSTTSSSVMQEVQEDNIENTRQTTVMTPVLVMSSDEKVEPNVVVVEERGNNIENQIEEKAIIIGPISEQVAPPQEDKRKVEPSERRTECSSAAQDDNAKRRKIESSSPGNTTTLKIESIQINVNSKINGTKKPSRDDDDKNMASAVSSRNDNSENSSPSISLNQGASDPQSLQISALVKHRKDLLERVQFCQAVCHMRLQQQQQEEDEIGAFRQLSQKVLQLLKKGSSRNNSISEDTDAQGTNSSLSSGADRTTPVRSSRGSNKKKSQSTAATQANAGDYLPSTPVHENLSAGKKVNNVPTQPLNPNNNLRINADVMAVHSSNNYVKETKSISSNSQQQPQQVLPRVSSMAKSSYGSLSNLSLTFPPPSSKLEGSRNQNFSPMGTVVVGSSILNISRKSPATKANPVLPLNATSNSTNAARAVVLTTVQKSTKSTGRVSNINSNTNLSKNSNKRSANSAGQMKNRGAETNSSSALPSSNAISTFSKKPSFPNPELQKLRDVRNSLRRKLSVINNQRKNKQQHNLDANQTLTDQKINRSQRATTATPVTSSPAKSVICTNFKFDSASSVIPISRLPPRRKTHWDYLLEEMRWLATDFIEERKWKIASSRTLSYSLHSQENNVDKTTSQCAETTAITVSTSNASRNTSNDISSPDIQVCKRVASLLSDMVLVHWDKMVREGALCAQDGKAIHEKVAQSRETYIEDMKNLHSSYSNKEQENTIEIVTQGDNDDKNDDGSRTSMDISTSSSSSPMRQSPSPVKTLKEAEEDYDSKSLYTQMANQIKSSTKTAKDIQSKLRRLRTTELQKSQTTWRNNNSGVSLTCLQLKMLRFMDTIWDLNGSAILSNCGTIGKTIAVAASLWKHRDDGPQLVLCPPNALIRWRHELRQFSELQVLTVGFSGGTVYPPTSTTSSHSPQWSIQNNSFTYNFQPKDIILRDLDFLDTGQQQDPLWKISWSSVILDARILPPTTSWHSTLDKFLSSSCRLTRKLLIEPPPQQEDDKDYSPTMDHCAIKLSFIHRAQKRKRTRFTKYEIFSWAKQECNLSNVKDEAFMTSIMDVFHQAISPFTFHHDDIEQRITPLSSYYKQFDQVNNSSKNILRKRKSRDSHLRQNLLQNKWVVRKCPMPELQSKSYTKCCRSLRGVFGIVPQRTMLSDSIHRFVSIANALFSLRQTCLHADLYSVLKKIGHVRDTKIQQCIYKNKTNSAQPNIALAQAIGSGSAKICELLKILTRDGGVECEIDVENGDIIWKKWPSDNISQLSTDSTKLSENVMTMNAKLNNGSKGSHIVITDNGNNTTLSSPSRVTRKSTRLQQQVVPPISPPKIKKILILASLPEVQVLLSMFLNSCGIAHELLTDQQPPRKTEGETHSSERNVSMYASKWTETQRSLIRFNNSQSNPPHFPSCHNNVLIVSPYAVTQHQGGLRINHTDLIIDVDSDWSGRSIDLFNSIVMACSLRREEGDDVKCIRLVCANTCEEYFLSKDPSYGEKSDDDSSDDDEPSLQIETDDYGYITAAFQEETDQPDLFLGRNIIHHRGKLLKDVLGIVDLPVEYTSGSDFLFLQRFVSLGSASKDTQLEQVTPQESTNCVNKLWKTCHLNESSTNEEELDDDDKLDILFGYIFAQIEGFKSSSDGLTKIESLVSKTPSTTWSYILDTTIKEGQVSPLYYTTSFNNVTSRQDLLTFPIRIYCESYGRKHFRLCNSNQDKGASQLLQQLDIAESWRKSGLGSSALEQILPLLVYRKTSDEDPRNNTTTPRKQKKRPLDATTITTKEEYFNESTTLEKKRRKKNNFYDDDVVSSSYRGNVYANLFISSLFSEIIPDGNQGMEYVLYTPPTFPALMSGWKHAKKSVSSSISLPPRKSPVDRTRVFKKKKKTSSSNHQFLANVPTQSMDLDDLTDDFLDSMAGADACSPLLDFDLSSDLPTSSRNDDTVQLSLDTMDNHVVPSNLVASPPFEQAAMNPSYQLPSRGAEDIKNASNIAAMDSMHMAVDDLDMFSPYAGDHDAHLSPSAAIDFLPHFTDTMLDLDFGDTTTPAPVSIEDIKPNGFDVVDMMDLTGNNLDTLPFLNTAASPAHPSINPSEDEQESEKQLHQLTWEIDYGLLGCGLLPLISDSVRAAATTPYDTARYRVGTVDSYYHDLYSWNFQLNGSTSILDSMVLCVQKSLSGGTGQGYKHGTTSARVKKPKKLHGFLTSDDLFANKLDEQVIPDQKSNKSVVAKNASISTCLMRRKIRSLVNKSFLSKGSGIPIPMLQHDPASSDIHHPLQQNITESKDTSSTKIVLAPAIQKLSASDSKTGDKAKVTSSAHRTALRRSLVAPQHVDFGPFSIGYLHSFSGFSGIVPPMSQVGIGLPLGVQAPTRESDFMREPWSEEEDVRLKDAAARFCFNWHMVSRAVTDIRRNPGIVLDGVDNHNRARGHSSTQEVWRCARQCRERWQAFAKAQPSLAKDVRKSERLLREMASVPPSKVPQSLRSLFSGFSSSNVAESSVLSGGSTMPSPSMLLSPSFYKRGASTSNNESSSSIFNIAQQSGEYGYLQGRLSALQESATKADYRSHQFSIPGCTTDQDKNSTSPHHPQSSIVQPHASHVQIAQHSMIVSHRSSSSQQQQQAEVWPLQLLDYCEKHRARATSQETVGQTSSSSRIQTHSASSSAQASSTSSVGVAASSTPQHQQQAKPSSQQQQRSHQVHSQQVPHQQVPHQQRRQQVQQLQQISSAMNQGGKNISKVEQVMNKDRIRVDAARPSPVSNTSATGIAINATNSGNISAQQQPYTVVTNPSYQQQHNPNIGSTINKETNNT